MQIVDEAYDEPIHLRFDAVGPSFAAWAGEHRIVAVSGRDDRKAFALNVDDDGRCSPTVAEQVLSQLERVAAPDAVMDSRNPVLRDQARRRGWTGPLRRPLTRGANPVFAGGVARGDGPVDADALVATIGQLVGPPVRLDRPAATRRWHNFARFGYGKALRLTVDPPGLSVTFPDRADVMAESVAGAIDTVLAVRAAFGGHAEHLREISFDRASHGGQRAQWVGKANHTVFTIHLDETLALADAWVQTARQGPVTMALHPYTATDAVTAHEAWHQIEFKFQGRRADHAAFRRALGEVLGVDTLEQAIQGGHQRAPEEHRRGFTRLAETVSAYATTNPLEATAEMFELWWCGATNPTLDCFGQQLERFFGISRR